VLSSKHKHTESPVLLPLAQSYDYTTSSYQISQEEAFFKESIKLLCKICNGGKGGEGGGKYT